MLFSSWTFLCFFACALLGYWAVHRWKHFRLCWLLAASYAFYGWLDWRFLLPLFTTTIVDYLAGLGIAKGKHPRCFLWLSVLVDLGLLCTFKYLNFFTENIQALCDSLHITATLPEFDLLLPAGISFYTFQSLSYTFGVYWKKLPAERNLLKYASFVALFPQILAGPIERAQNMLPQLERTPHLTSEDLGDGISLFLTGMFKKVVMADMLAKFVNAVWDAPADFTGVTVLLAALLFSWQIYFDFSGYSDMARGVARFLGLRLMLNFDNPYTSLNVKEFWRKWHISLSSWFKDHIYIPMGGSRCSRLRCRCNVMATMLVSGLWHGAAWNFIFWGALNGLGSCFPLTEKITARIPRLLRQLGTFLFMTVTWVFFKSSTLGDAWCILKRSVSWNAEGTALLPLFPIVLIAVIWSWQLLYDQGGKCRAFLEKRPVRLLALSGILLLLLLLGGGKQEQFIYFQF